MQNLYDRGYTWRLLWYLWSEVSHESWPLQIIVDGFQSFSEAFFISHAYPSLTSIFMLQIYSNRQCDLYHFAERKEYVFYLNCLNNTLFSWWYLYNWSPCLVLYSKSPINNLCLWKFEVHSTHCKFWILNMIISIEIIQWSCKNSISNGWSSSRGNKTAKYEIDFFLIPCNFHLLFPLFVERSLWLNKMVRFLEAF